MTDTQHTPGPWQTEWAPKGQGPWVGRIAEGRWAALACGKTDEEADANARLIAASPEILGALLNTADALDQLMREGAVKPGHPYAPHVRDLIDNARAAIAKASGQ